MFSFISKLGLSNFSSISNIVSAGSSIFSFLNSKNISILLIVLFSGGYFLYLDYSVDNLELKLQEQKKINTELSVELDKINIINNKEIESYKKLILQLKKNEKIVKNENLALSKKISKLNSLKIKDTENNDRSFVSFFKDLKKLKEDN